ncbi:MAG TPA: site-specific integrase [Erysipelotrichaceae bacterium]|nr:site-specific integrase [Erysipelotrichaceae bacterium]
MPTYKSKTKTKDGRQWYYSKQITVNGRTRRYRSRLFATKREAEKAESLLLLSADETAAEKVTFGIVAETLLNQKESVLKPTGYKKLQQQVDHILSVLEDVEIDRMTVQDYQRLRKYLDGRDFSVSYKNNILVTLKSLCKFADLYFNVKTNIPDRFERYADKSAVRQEMNFYTFEEFTQFISAVDDLRFRTFFILLFYNGLRSGEANALLWSDIDFKAKEVRINKTVTTKMRDGQGNYLVTTPKTKGSVRTLPLANVPLNALKTLKEYYSTYDGFSDNWYVFGGLRAMPESNIQKAKNKYVRLSGVKNIRIHDLRHSCASLLINHGANITLVSKYLGHSTISMTLDIYSHFYKSKMDELIDSLDGLGTL